MAMIYLRENALEYSIDKAHIAAIGFSAGGHLTGMLGTMFEDTEVLSAFGKRASLIRPDAIILSYAVITMQEEWSHGGTKRVISDNGKIPQDKLSIEKRVTPQSSPAFIWHTMEDNAVPVENSLLLANAYRKEGVPFSLHIFEHGWHGLSLCNEETHNQTARDEEVSYVGAWQKLSYDWLRACGFVVKSLKNNNKR
jgi:acetyl esterase/lipase